MLEMVNDKTEKKINLKNKQKKLELTRQTHDIDHKTEITIRKQTATNYKVQYPINQALNDEIREKTLIFV